MIPNKSLAGPISPFSFLEPDKLTTLATVDYQLGGIGLSDPSQGLQVQTWTAEIIGEGTSTSVQISAPNTIPVILFSLSNLSWVRLAFDQNMHPVVAYQYLSGSGFWWFDPTIPGTTFFALPAGSTYPCCSLDDKRPLSTNLGTSDVIVAYLNSTNLLYRQERDRYANEYVLATSLTSYIAAPLLNKIGMDSTLRLLFDIRGVLYQ